MKTEKIEDERAWNETWGRGIDANDAKALIDLTDKVARQNVLVAEIGSWKGLSTLFLGLQVRPYRGKVFVIDHWRGDPGDQVIIAKQRDVFGIFRRNMIMMSLWHTEVFPLLMDSLTASQIFADHILDLVFIDADHRYDAVKADIDNWLPKVKVGGIISGHDCHCKYTNCSQRQKEEIDANLNTRNINLEIIDCHPGVSRALYDAFNDEYSMADASTVWYKEL